MRFQEAKTYIEEMGKDGYAASVATDKELRIVATYVDADAIGYADIATSQYGFPMIVGGKYNGHRLIHHSVHVEVGQRICGRPFA